MGKLILDHLKEILYRHPNKIDRSILITDLLMKILRQPILRTSRGPPHRWKHADDIICQMLLFNVIQYCRDISERFVRGHTTNYNGAFHALKAKFVPKNFNLGNTGKARLLACILEYIEKILWVEHLYQRLGIPQTHLARFKYLKRRFLDLRIVVPHEDLWWEEYQEHEEEVDNERLQREDDRLHHIPLHV